VENSLDQKTKLKIGKKEKMKNELRKAAILPVLAASTRKKLAKAILSGSSASRQKVINK